MIELADLVVVNKADLDPGAATRAVAQIAAALHLVAHRESGAWTPRALVTSALDPAQVAAVWDVVAEFRSAQEANGALQARRRGQARAWLWERVDAGLREAFRAHPGVRAQLGETIAAVDAGRLPVSVAARRLLRAFTHDGVGAVEPS